jgi:hypothetical protein
VRTIQTRGRRGGSAQTETAPRCRRRRVRHWWSGARCGSRTGHRRDNELWVGVIPAVRGTGGHFDGTRQAAGDSVGRMEPSADALSLGHCPGPSSSATCMRSSTRRWPTRMALALHETVRRKTVEDQTLRRASRGDPLVPTTNSPCVAGARHVRDTSRFGRVGSKTGVRSTRGARLDHPRNLPIEERVVAARCAMWRKASLPSRRSATAASASTSRAARPTCSC